MKRSKHIMVATVILLCSLAVASTAFARAGFEWKVDRKVQAGDGYPSLSLQATGDIESGTVTFKRSDGESFSKNLGSMSSGETKKIDIKQPAGTYKYDVSIEATGPGDEGVSTDFELEATLVESLELSVDPKKVRIGQGEVPVSTNRPMDRVEVEILDSNGQKLYGGTQNLGGKKGSFTVKWPATEDVGGIRLKAYDVDGFWRGVLLEPFWVKIPHKEVIFNFGKASWNDSEEPKLEDTLDNLRDAMKKHRDKGLQMQLYVAGYTDTVGSESANQKLSTTRARAIAHWFQTKGLDIPIYYQGFGESVLAVNTDDETKEEKNRRAIYVLGNAQPPTSEALPRSDWKRIQ
jgi:outer membrane protein OmpA-like peptidoglycan-associated protein